MNSKIILSIFILFICTRVSIGQKTAQPTVNCSFNFGSVDPNSKKETLLKIFHDDGTNVYTVSTIDPAKYGYVSPKVKPAITKYNDKFEPIARLEIEANEGNEQYIGIYEMQDIIFFLKSRYNRDSKKLDVIVKKISNDLKMEESDIVLSSVEGEIYKEPGIEIAFSADRKKCCLVLIPEQKKNEKKEIKALTFDNKFVQLLERKLTFEKESELLMLKELALSNDGDFFLLSKIYDNKLDDENSDNKPGYSYSLVKYNAQGETAFKFNSDNKFIESTELIVDSKDDLRLAITYENNYGKGIVGMKYFKFNANNGQDVNNVDFQFDKTTIEKMNLLSDKNQAKGHGFGWVVPDWDPNSIGPFYVISMLDSDSDGSTYLILERNVYKTPGRVASKRDVNRPPGSVIPAHYMPSDAYLIKTPFSENVHPTQGNNYFSEGVVVVKIDSSGAKWQRAIPKLQFYSLNPSYLFSLPVFHKNKLCIIYNDDKENVNYNIETAKSAPKRFNDFKAVNLMKIEIDKDGNTIRSKIGDTSSLGTIVDIAHSKQTSNERIIIRGLTMNSFGDNKQSKMGVIKLQ